MSLHANQLETAWSKLHMEVKDKTRHRFASLRVNGKVIVTTLRSRGSGEVDAIHKIRQQMHLDEPRFQELIACPLDRPKYLDILVSKRVLDSDELKSELHGAGTGPPGKKRPRKRARRK